MAGFAEILERSGLPAQVIGAPPLFDIVFAAGEIADYRGMLRADAARYQRLTRALRENGILKGESKFYVSLAHDERVIEESIEIFAQAFDALG
jgi:glutamate-1-semialdehyde 2,1-aminomutase